MAAESGCVFKIPDHIGITRAIQRDVKTTVTVCSSSLGCPEPVAGGVQLGDKDI